MSFNLPKTKILVKDMLPADAHHIARNIITTDCSLHTLRTLIDRPDVFVADGILTVGVPLGTDAFVSAYVAATCKEISTDIDKLDPLTDGFVHYQLVRFCQATRLQYLNVHIPKYELTSYQQAHVDVKITDALLKKGTNQLSTTWSKGWIRARLQDSHAEGGFGITPNSLTSVSGFYTSTARFVQWGGQLGDVARSNYFPSVDLTDTATWNTPILTRLIGIHSSLLHDCKCQEASDPTSHQPASHQPPPPAPPQPPLQPPPPQQPPPSQDTGILVLAQLNQLASPAQPSSADKTAVSVPTQRRVIRQFMQHNPRYIALRQTTTHTRSAEQQKLQTAQKYRAVSA